MNNCPSGSSAMMNQEYEKVMEMREEEIQQLKNKIDIMMMESLSKDNIIESLKEDNEQL